MNVFPHFVNNNRLIIIKNASRDREAVSGVGVGVEGLLQLF